MHPKKERVDIAPKKKKTEIIKIFNGKVREIATNGRRRWKERIINKYQEIIQSIASTTFWHWAAKPVTTTVLAAITMLCIAGLDFLYELLFSKKSSTSAMKAMLVIEEAARFMSFSIYLLAELLKNIGILRR